jgi:hypothetical protein
MTSIDKLHLKYLSSTYETYPPMCLNQYSFPPLNSIEDATLCYAMISSDNMHLKYLSSTYETYPPMCLN